jgi:DNA-binding XRE family transcriptional regulator
MAGHTPWSKIRDKLPPEQRERVAERVKDIKIGMLIAELREEHGMTQQEVANKLGISQPGVSQMEAGEEIQLSTLRELVGTMGGEVILHMPNRDISLTHLTNET